MSASLPSNNHHHDHGKKLKVKSHLHFVIAEGLDHFEIDLLTFYKKKESPLMLHLLFGFQYAVWLSMELRTQTKPGVQKQPANALRIAVFLILEDLTGYNFLHHLRERKNGKVKNNN